jgi:hypothetical protein
MIPGWCMNGPEDVKVEGDTYECYWQPGTRNPELCCDCVYFSIIPEDAGENGET